MIPETEHYLEATKSFIRKFPHLELAYDREVDAFGSFEVSFSEIFYLVFIILVKLEISSRDLDKNFEIIESRK